MIGQSAGQEDPWPPGFDCIYPTGLLIILSGEHDSRMLVTEALVWAAPHTWLCLFTVFVMPRCETALLHSCHPVRHSCPRKHATWSSCSRSSIHKIFFGLEISLILTFLAATARSGEFHQATCLSRFFWRYPAVLACPQITRSITLLHMILLVLSSLSHLCCDTAYRISLLCGLDAEKSGYSYNLG